ncbi:MAG: hypothetical protein AAFO94_08375 [Bacteroidota bacterium]
MKSFSTLLVFGLIICCIGACADPDKSPILTFEKLGKGAYVKLLESAGSETVNLFDPQSFEFDYSVEFVDIDQGNTVSEFRLEMLYIDNNQSNGDKSAGPNVWKTFSSGEFDTTERGFKGKQDIKITLNDFLSTTGVTVDDLLSGDQFRIKSYLVTNDGTTFGADNSSAAVNGDAFGGFFDVSFVAKCPTGLSGTYPFETTSIWCPEGNTATGEVTISSSGGESYAFDDWSFGSYKLCYDTTTDDWGSLKFEDICNKVSFVGLDDKFGNKWSFDSSVDGEKWTIEWSNNFGESGTTVITNPDGDWPFGL